jgi:cyclohexa-1,5-dienecarbonyl-CoA hydratase
VTVRTIEDYGGSWLRIVLDQPPGNVLSRDMVRGLTMTLDASGSARKWITFEGAGNDFCFGAAVQEHVPGMMERVLPETHALFRRILALPAPTAALVQGRCLGGGFELALMCDVMLAAHDATLGLPEINLGAFPPAGAALLPLRIGASRATASVLTGAPRTAAEWKEAGLVEVIADPGQVIHAARQWFEKHLAPRSRVALAAAAQASRLALRSVAEPAIAAAEQLYLERVLRTSDAAEGVRAFAEKRRPRWKDE